MQLTLQNEWVARLKLHAQSKDLYLMADSLSAQEIQIYNQGLKLQDEIKHLHEKRDSEISQAYALVEKAAIVYTDEKSPLKRSSAISANGYLKLAHSHNAHARAHAFNKATCGILIKNGLLQLQCKTLQELIQSMYSNAYALQAQGDEIFANAVLASFGDIALKFYFDGHIGQNCELENGEVYRADMLYEDKNETN